MYLDIKSGIIEKSELTMRECDSNFEVFWDGFIFYPGLEEGSTTIKQFLNSIGSNNSCDEIIKKTHQLRGNWALFIHVLKDGTWIVCSDHSHQTSIYYSETAVSTSFLKLREDLSDKSKLSDEALILMLSSSSHFSNNVIYDTIMKLDYQNYIHLDNANINVCSKHLENVIGNRKNAGDFGSIMHSFFSSLSKYNICLDLTGGTDTRSISILLTQYGHDFDVAINGDPNFSESKVALEVAKRIGKELKCYEIEADKIKQEDLRLAWEACDGLDISLGSYFFELWRKKMGYTLTVTGKAGNLYKDDSFFRYAVLYSLTMKNVKDLVDTLVKKSIIFWWGIPFNELLNMLSDDYRSIATEVMNNKAAEITSKYSQYSLIEAANRICYEFSLNTLQGNGNNIVKRFYPLFEPDLVAIGTSLPITKRFNARFYRKNVGRLNPDVARISTFPLGNSISDSFINILSDYYRLFKHGIVKIVNYNFKPSRIPNKNDLILEEYIRKHPDIINGLANLKDKGIIDGKIDLANLSNKAVYNIIGIYYLMES
jgi:hypothetical protein